jgi:hypothetical protein
VKRRIWSNAVSRRSNIWFSKRASSEISSFTSSTGTRSFRLSERMRLAVSRMIRTGRSTSWERPNPSAMLASSITTMSAALTFT